MSYKTVYGCDRCKREVTGYIDDPLHYLSDGSGSYGDKIADLCNECFAELKVFATNLIRLTEMPKPPVPQDKVKSKKRGVFGI